MIELGTVSSRGQIAIPAEMRNSLRLNEGDKILFWQENKEIMIKKMDKETFLSLTEDLRKSKKRINEEEVNTLVHARRKSRS